MIVRRGYEIDWPQTLTWNAILVAGMVITVLICAAYVKAKERSDFADSPRGAAALNPVTFNGFGGSAVRLANFVEFARRAGASTFDERPTVIAFEDVLIDLVFDHDGGLVLQPQVIGDLHAAAQQMSVFVQTVLSVAGR